MERIHYERHDLALKELPFIFNKCHCHAKALFQASLYANWHESIEIIFVTKGRGRIICDFTEHEVSEGDIFVINSDVLHAFSVLEDDFFEYYYIIVGRDFCLSNGIDTDSVLFFEKIQDSDCRESYEKVVSSYLLDVEYKGLAIRSAVLELLFTLASKYIRTQHEKEEKRPLNLENVRRAIIYIRENFSKKITVKDLALASGISEYYFIREFKRITRYTPVTYINMIRCDTAKKLLSEGEYNVGEVADMCGFDNMPYFTKTFKKYTGELPSQVKKK